VISPYVISGYVTGADFYGRRDLLGEITAGRYCGTYILGTRQVGKTSLLRQVEMQVPAIFLDLQLASERLEELIGWARREVHHKRQNWPWLPPEEDLPTGDLFDLLTTLDKQVLEAGQRLWVLMDEAEIWVHFARTNPEVLHRLRGTVQNCSALRVVLVAAKRLSEANTLTGKTGSPFLSGFAVRYLGPLSQRDGAALLRQDQSPTPVAVENGLLSHLLSLAGGHPLLLQLLGERLYEDGQLRSPTEGDLVGVLDQVVNITGVLPNDFAALSDPERAILRMLSSGQPLPHGTNPTYLHGLTALGVLRREGDSYAIGNDFFARWLREQADWAVKPEISAEGTLAVYTQFEPGTALIETQEQAVQLRRVLADRFNESELRTLCFDLGIESENLPGDTREALARELVAYCVRHGQIPKLVEVGRQLRPDISWEDVHEEIKTL